MSWSRVARGVRLVGPLSDESSWQARRPDGLTSAQFRLDWAQQVAVCPQGQRSRSWSLHDNADGQPVVDIEFAKSICDACPVHERCTRGAAGRTLQLSIYHDAILAARQDQQTAAFQEQYTLRAGIEGTVSETCVHTAHARHITSAWLRRMCRRSSRPSPST